MVDTSRTRLRRSDEKSRRLPSLEVSRIAENPQITRMLMQVKEILERRFGPTAPIFERAVTWGELFERGVVDIRDETGVLARTKDKISDLALRVNGETIEPGSIGMNALNFDVTVAAKNEGTEITGYMLTIDFVGSGVTASASGSDVTVTINGPAAASESAAGIAEIATQAEVDGGTDDARFVTPLKLASSVWAKKKSGTLIGDGSATSYTVTHNLGTRDVIVSVYLNSGTYEEVFCDVEHTSTNSVTLKFSSAPTSNQYRVVVIG